MRLEARRHGVVLVRPLALALALAACGALVSAAGSWFSVAAAGLVAAGAAVALRAVWRWERTHVVVTTDKLYVAYGTLRRRAAAVRLTRVGTVEIEQTLLGRLLGYGTIVAGELEIDYVPDPRRVYGLLAR